MEDQHNMKPESKQYFAKRKEVLSSYQLYQYENMLRAVIKDRKIFIWSACYKSDWIYELCIGFGIEINGFIDTSPLIKEWKSLPVLKISNINPNESFVFVALEMRYDSVLEELKENNFIEYIDYIYPLKSSVAFSERNEGILNHLDFRGNEYRGHSSNIVLDVGCKCYIGLNVRIKENVNIILKKNAVLIIEDGCTIQKGASITVDDAILIIRKKCVFGNNFLARVSVKSYAVIGAGTTCGINFMLAVSRMAYCNIGSDCMISDDVRIQASDSHDMYDLSLEKNLWFEKKYKVILGDHVWIGAKSIIRYGANIGNGSIVGIGSWVNKVFVNNVILAGSPAKLIRKDVAWKRDHKTFEQQLDCFSQFDYRDKENG